MGQLAAIAGIAAGGLQIAGGIQANREARRQARIARLEAAERAQARKREIGKFRAKQIVSFLKSGVTLEGTPSAVLTETEQLGAQEIGSIIGAGEERAKGLRRRGRQALLSGISGGIGSFASAGQSAGAFSGGIR